MLVSAKTQSKNLGDIVCNSIRVMDDGTGGFIHTYNADGKKTVYIGSGEDGGSNLWLPEIITAKRLDILKQILIKMKW